MIWPFTTAVAIAWSQQRRGGRGTIAFDGKQSSRADPAGDRFPRPAAAPRAMGLATMRSSQSSSARVRARFRFRPQAGVSERGAGRSVSCSGRPAAGECLGDDPIVRLGRDLRQDALLVTPTSMRGVGGLCGVCLATQCDHAVGVGDVAAHRCKPSMIRCLLGCRIRFRSKLTDYRSPDGRRRRRWYARRFSVWGPGGARRPCPQSAARPRKQPRSRCWRMGL